MELKMKLAVELTSRGLCWEAVEGGEEEAGEEFELAERGGCWKASCACCWLGALRAEASARGRVLRAESRPRAFARANMVCGR